MTGKGTPEPDSTDAPERLERQALDCIRNALRGLRFGQVTVVVQDGIVVQVERTERIRPPRAGGKRQ
ncbi:MAG: YezD family protein [Planctomycetia bacterium]|nr:YezD family protein [Planctomycetia bacterium]